MIDNKQVIKKKTKTTLFFSVLLLLLVVSFTYPPLATLSWKAYSNPTITFNFKYPPSWHVCEEFYKNLDEYFVHVSDRPIDCTDLSFSPNSKYLTIYQTSKKSTDENENIKTWLDRTNREAEEAEKKSLLEGGLPSSGGSSWEFVRYNEKILSGQRPQTVAEVKGFGDYPEFVVMSQGNIYSFKFAPMDGLGSRPLKLILKTLRSN